MTIYVLVSEIKDKKNLTEFTVRFLNS